MNDLMAKVSTLSVNRIAIFGMLLTMFYYFMIYNNGDLILAEIQGINSQIAEETNKKVETERVLPRPGIPSISKCPSQIREAIIASNKLS